MSDAHASAGAPARPAGARRPALSLRLRALLLAGLGVTLIVGLASWLEVRAIEHDIRTDLLTTARQTAEAVADDLSLRPDPLNVDDLTDSLHDFVAAVPAIRVISVVTLQQGMPTVLASTSTAARAEALAVARRSIETTRIAPPAGTGTLQTLAVPVIRDDRLFGAVAVTVSLGAVQEVRTRGWRIALWLVPAAVLALTLLVDTLTRRLFQRPIGTLVETMERVSAGDQAARAPVIRRDEIGELATGLNQMLAELEELNAGLQTRVREATEELRGRNAELVDSYQRMFALREALARAEQLAAVGQMAASVAHQIGTPLNLVSGYVQMLMEEAGPQSRLRERLQIIEEQIQKVAAVVRSMLDRARPASPRVPVDLRALVQRVADVARPALEAAGVQLTLDAPVRESRVSADEVQLELALLNLISNSLDAMPSGGRLQIAMAEADGRARITIADSGTGIAADLLPQIFEPWVTTKPVGRGTGLGLSITRDVVVAHGGTIVAENRAEGGARFTVELPLCAAS
ncbi:MAG: HAMP domain-containing protein [Acidobacteriota bacterium]|nr:HAMP domain-containing protein [Acidobacteriota bacterium]